MQLKIIVLSIFLLGTLEAKEQCSPYFDPNKFYESPEFLVELLDKNNIENKPIKFTIQKKELYRYTKDSIANEINDNFGGFWIDWIEDAYEMTLVPQQVLFKYKNSYFSLNVTIEGTLDDATKLKGTIVNYNFYNYSKQVYKHIECKKANQ